MDGRALTAFQYNKIGFNVHHALSESIGRRYRVRTPVGEISGVFPRDIDPQRVEDGRLTGMFLPYDWLGVELPSGLEARFTFEGDQFEMQDHRNWTDANFKSYGTPLSVPFPMDAAVGQAFHQKVTISFDGPLELAPPRPGPPSIAIGQSLGRRLPLIGFGMPSHGDALSEAEADLIRAVRPAHLRADLHPADEGVGTELERAERDAARLDAPLEVALFLTQDAEAELARTASLFEAARPSVARVLVFAEGGFAAGLGSTPAELVTRARAVLGPILPGVPFGGGSNVFFADINRDRPAAGEWDLVAYPICPTVHAADDASIVENLAAHAETLAMTRSLVGNAAIAISPVTLATRFGPYPGGPPEPDGLPGPVDPRQLVGLPGRGPYSAAKAGMLGLTREMAVELAPAGIRVNAVAPGFTRTGLVEQAIKDGSLNEQWMLERVPMGRLAEPDEIARVVRFLASDDASYITGQCLIVDGGWTVQGIGAAPDWLARPG